MYVGDKPGGIWLSPTSRLGTGGFLNPCVWPSVSPPLGSRGLSVSNLRKLQCIQNSLARIVCKATCLSHTTPLRKALHWLPIRHRCIFKTALLVYKYLHTNCPKYFSPFLKVRQCAYNTRLSQTDGIILHVPQYQPSIYKSTKQFGLSFAYDAPKIWNE